MGRRLKNTFCAIIVRFVHVVLFSITLALPQWEERDLKRAHAGVASSKTVHASTVRAKRPCWKITLR